MNGVELTGVVKKFSEVQVIHGVDLQINEGEFCVFVGPSGCGKSTLLRMIAGLETTTDGKIEIQGNDVTDTDPAKRGVAMVFQTYALYPHMTVGDNMRFGLRMGGMDKASIDAKVDNAARILKLESYMDRKPKALSGGQRQRVAIGRAIVREPKVFLFDEPLSNLDAELRVQMRLEIARLHKRLSATMIYVTHDQVEAMTLADKIVVLRDGRVEQYGSPVELYENPNNQFVAQFIGSPKMNVLDAVVQSVNGSAATVSLTKIPDTTFALSTREPLAKGSKVRVGIRPEQFTPNGAVKMKLDVDVVENLGGVSYAYVVIEDGEDPLTIELRAKQAAEDGQTIQVGFDPADVLIFDPESGSRIL